MYMSSFLHMIDRLDKVHGIRARIFSVEYRMCPEQQWPVSRQDCEKAYAYLVRDLQLDPSKIIIGKWIFFTCISSCDILTFTLLYRW